MPPVSTPNLLSIKMFKFITQQLNIFSEYKSFSRINKVPGGCFEFQIYNLVPKYKIHNSKNVPNYNFKILKVQIRVKALRSVKVLRRVKTGFIIISVKYVVENLSNINLSHQDHTCNVLMEFDVKSCFLSTYHKYVLSSNFLLNLYKILVKI